VGSVGNGSTLRLISDIEGVKYTEGRFLPYFFPDTFHEGGDPVREAKENWVTARRAILRKPIDRIGYGGYLKLALQFPEFVDYVESVCNEFRELYENIKGTTPYCVKRVAVLNCWGKMRAWGCHMVHHALYYKQNYSYAGVIEMLSGAPFDVKFISFEDIKNDPHLLDRWMSLSMSAMPTPHTPAASGREDPEISSAIRKFVWNGGGFIGVGEPSGHPYQGHILQLATVLGVEEEKRLHPELRQIQLGGDTPTTLSCRTPTSPWTLARAKRTSTPSKAPRCWCSGTRKCRWPPTTLARGVPCTSAACRTALPTAVPCTVLSCGAPRSTCRF